MKNLVLLVFAILCNVNLAWTQCSIQTSTNNVCLGNTVSFSRTPASASDSAFLWDFGDGSSSTQSGTTYQYTTAGTYTINLKIYKYGGTICTPTPKQIKVFPKPNALFTVNNKSQCYNYNNFLFTDLSGPGASNAPLKRRTFLYGDGALFQENRPFISSPSHVYTSANGGTYNVVLEVEDTNGCLNQMAETMIVYPQVVASFNVTPSPKCGSNYVEFTNYSFVSNTVNEKFWWFTDDGNILTGKLGISHTYYGDTSYYPSLVVEDGNGCRDTAVMSSPIVSFKPDSIIHITPQNARCYNGNEFSFYNKTRVNEDNAYFWHLSDSTGALQRGFLSKDINNFQFPSCGVYDVLLLFSYNGCEFRSDTQVVVYGPQTIISTQSSPIINRFQCIPHDTVWFRVEDYSCYYKNDSLAYFWDFDDSYAPSCTTDTKNNINVGLNCRYSKDSINTFHLYKHPNSNCYAVKLITTDLRKNCSDATQAQLALSPPKIGFDYTTSPPTARAYADWVRCSNSPIMVYWPGVEPRCYPESIWILPDSSCADKKWFRADTNATNKSFAIDYSHICTNDSIVYFGIVARNGTDALGNFCYDTAYYSYINSKALDYIPFKFENTDSNLCAPHHLVAKPLDSINYRVGKIEYWFSTEADPFIIEKQLGDSIIKPFYYQTNKSGIVSLLVRCFSYDGCLVESNYSIQLGYGAHLKVNTPLVCNGTPASFSATVRYVSDTSLGYWSDSLRAKNGFEKLFWNFGDSIGWIQGSESMYHTYKTHGVYNIRVSIKDSTGCFDTLQNPSYNVVVSSVVAKPTATQDTFYCAPTIVTYYDSSLVIYGNNPPRYGLINSRQWAFSDNKGSSVLLNPGVYYDKNGTYFGKLRVTSNYGCIDSSIKSIVVIGPQPRFVILNDTFGCVPYTVQLRNATNSNLRNWIWSFNDPLNTILATDRDTNFQFTYTTPGVFKIDLLGEDRIFNPTTGSFKTCAQSFPTIDSTTNFHPRQVVVLPYDSLKIIVPDTVCVLFPFSTLVSGTNQITKIKWSWGDTKGIDEVFMITPATHIYDSSGSYQINAYPIVTSSSQCVKPTSKIVFARSPEANFTYDIKTYPDIQFQNLSINGARFLWDFGDANSSSNTSVAINPTHQFSTGDTLFKVCLSAFDDAGCMDSVCKNILLNARVKIPNVFTPGNNDDKNDAFDIDIEGYLKYELFIYNRWGTLVYQSLKDGYKNDGINWNGKDKNSGNDCPEGVYYVVFNYQLVTEKEENVYHGTVTLIRN